MNAQKDKFTKMMNSEEYDISDLIGSISSEEDYDIVANLLYFELDQVAVCNFFKKSNEFLLENRKYYAVDKECPFCKKEHGTQNRFCSHGCGTVYCYCGNEYHIAQDDGVTKRHNPKCDKEEPEPFENYRVFQRTFNRIKFKMNEILRKRLGTKEDDFVVSITDFSGITHTYIIDLTEMTISHSNSTGDYILNYEEDTKWVEYLLSKDPDIHLNFWSRTPHIIKVSRVITPIQTFVLRKI